MVLVEGREMTFWLNLRPASKVWYLASAIVWIRIIIAIVRVIHE